MTTLQPRPVLIGSISHGDWLTDDATFTIPRRADPPSASGGVALGADDTATSSGGVAGGFTLREGEASIWGLLTQPDGCAQPQDLSDLLTALAVSPELRSAALLRGLERFRDQLDQLPGHTPLEQPVTVAAADLMVLVRALLGRLR